MSQKMNSVNRVFFQKGFSLSLLFLLSLPLLSCQPQIAEKDLLFRSIEEVPYPQFNLPKWFDSKSPGMIVIQTEQEYSKLANMVSPASFEVLQNADYSKFFFICVFQGLKSTTDYSVRVTRISIAGSVIRVYVDFKDPPHDILVGMMETSPYHLVEVENTPDVPELDFKLVSNGKSIDFEK